MRLANGVGALAAFLDRRGRAVALANLECVFGTRLSEARRAEILRQSYRNFALTMFSLFWASRLTDRDFRNWMHLQGWDQLVARLEREQRGAILVCVHQGNWEWASLATSFLGIQVKVVAGNFKNPGLAGLFSAARQHSGVEIIAQEHAMIRMLKTLQRGGAIGVLGDLSFVRDRAATVVTAWGLKMVVPALPAALAQRTGALLVPVVTEPLPDGTCRIVAHPPVETPAEASVPEIAQRLWTVFEREIEQQPALWLWPYKFFRCRPRGGSGIYPFYANESGGFEKLLRPKAPAFQKRPSASRKMTSPTPA
ncbi:MAG: Kdo2-lipid lauroyltransferase/acyltransferase [Chthoniobacter sp.]|jgi:KDO2-lipid IV(A) lauroyltransferase|nr:Kdo2-lipid lauroyltransferase/acyltransferase [Chthoniobacter sp.]